MSIFWIILLALSLSVDTFAVAVSGGILCKRIVFRQAVFFSFVMAFFQACMPVLGWLVGKEVHIYIESFDHWVASGLLFVISVRMIIGAFSEDENRKINPLRFRTMLSLAIATSIDALAVGFSFTVIEVNVFLSVMIIGSVTFLASMTGLLIGKNTAAKFGKPLEVIGAIILIAIGIKIILLHL